MVRSIFDPDDQAFTTRSLAIYYRMSLCEMWCKLKRMTDRVAIVILIISDENLFGRVSLPKSCQKLWIFEICEKSLCWDHYFFIMVRRHGSLAQAGKVRASTPKVEKMGKPKTVRGRAHVRQLYNKRFLSTNPDAKRKVGPNSQAQ